MKRVLDVQIVSPDQMDEFFSFLGDGFFEAEGEPSHIDRVMIGEALTDNQQIVDFIDYSIRASIEVGPFSCLVSVMAVGFLMGRKFESRLKK